MGAAHTAGANLRKNAQSIDFGQIVQGAIATALSGMDRALPVLGTAKAAIPVAMDFASGLAGGQAPAASVAPQTMTKAQQKAAPAAGGAFVDLPGVGKVQMPSEAFLKANPMVPVQAPRAAAQPAATTSTTERAPAAAGGGFEDMIARFAQAAGGVSLNELAVLSDSSYKTTKSAAAPLKPADELIAHLAGLNKAGYQQTLANAAAHAKKQGITEEEFISNASKDYFNQQIQLLKQGPTDIATAGLIDGR